MSDTNAPGAKEKALYYLKTLMELVENDRVRADQIEGLTADQVIALAETEAAKAAENAGNLAAGN